MEINKYDFFDADSEIRRTFSFITPVTRSPP